MSHTEQILNRVASEQGWDRDTQLDLALRYIEEQQDPDTFEDFLRGIQETENAEEGTLRGLPALPTPQDTGDPHADFHQRSLVPWGSPLCGRCATQKED